MSAPQPMSSLDAIDFGTPTSYQMPSGSKLGELAEIAQTVINAIEPSQKPKTAAQRRGLHVDIPPASPKAPTTPKPVQKYTHQPSIDFVRVVVRLQRRRRFAFVENLSSSSESSPNSNKSSPSPRRAQTPHESSPDSDPMPYRLQQSHLPDTDDHYYD